MSRTDPQFNLRIPEELRDRVMTAAKTNKRSATAEIIARLEASFSTAPMMVIVDECHRSKAPSSGRALELIEQLKAELVGVTATPEKQP